LRTFEGWVRREHSQQKKERGEGVHAQTPHNRGGKQKRGVRGKLRERKRKTKVLCVHEKEDAIRKEKQIIIVIFLLPSHEVFLRKKTKEWVTTMRFVSAMCLKTNQNHFQI